MKGLPSRAETAREKGSKYQLDVPNLTGGFASLSLSKGSGRPEEAGKTSASTTLQPATAITSHRHVGLDDFTFLAVLGKGNFGKVMLAEEIKTRCLFAIKVLKKEHILKNDEVDR